MGGGGGKILHIGRQAVNAYVQAFDDVVRPHEDGTWTLRPQLPHLRDKVLLARAPQSEAPHSRVKSGEVIGWAFRTRSLICGF